MRVGLGLETRTIARCPGCVEGARHLIAIDDLPDGMLFAIDGLPGCPSCVEGALHEYALRASLGMSLEFHASPCLEPRPFFPSSHATVY